MQEPEEDSKLDRQRSEPPPPAQEPSGHSGQPGSEPPAKPSGWPAGHPGSKPSGWPAGHPGSKPSGRPAGHPATQPSGRPVAHPTSQPSDQSAGHPPTQPSGWSAGHPASANPAPHQPTNPAPAPGQPVPPILNQSTNPASAPGQPVPPMLYQPANPVSAPDQPAGSRPNQPLQASTDQPAETAAPGPTEVEIGSGLSEHSSSAEPTDKSTDPTLESSPAAKRMGLGLENKLPPQAQSFLQQYVDTARAVIVTPKQFFAAMPQTGGFKEPAIFMLAGSAVFAVFQSIVNFKLLDIPLNLLIAFGGRCLVAAVAYGAAKAMGVKEARFEGLFRVVAYSSCLAVIGWVPVLGQAAAFIYGCVLYYFGFEKVLQSERNKTLQVVFAAIIFSGLIMLAIVVINMLGQIAKMLFGGA